MTSGTVPMTPVPEPWVFDSSSDPPVHTRRMVSSEFFIQKHWNTTDADGQISMGLTFTSSLGLGKLKDRVRDALDKLRFVCPIIACTVEGIASPRWVYTPSADRNAWLDLSFAVEDRGPSLRTAEFIQEMNFKRLPYKDEHGTVSLFRVYLLTASKEDNGDREYGLYFHGPHSIIDGGPGLHALNLMCEWISSTGMEVKIDPLEECKNLPVDPVTATGGPSPEWETAGTQLMQVFARQRNRFVPRICISPSRPLNMSEPPIFLSRSLSKIETAAIVAATKKLGVSVSTIFHAAHCLAQYNMNPELASLPELDFPTDATVVALDRYFKPPVNPKTHIISSYSLLPLRFSMTEPLKEPSEKGKLIATAKILQQQFNTYLTNPCLPQSFSVMIRATQTDEDEETTTQAEVPYKQPAFMPWYCAFNNLGVIENRLQTDHGALAVTHLSLGVRLRNYMTVHMWSMHARLHFQVLAATAWGEECVQTLLEETIRIGSLVVDAE